MMKKALFFGFILIATVFTSCSKYQKLLKDSDNELKYTKALEYYEKGDFAKAQQLLEQVQVFFRGTDKAEKIAYYTAYCYYKQKDYILGGYYFKSFTTNYSASPYAEEALYLSAYCSYLESPRSSLDQTSTNEAIGALQLFINQYPNSARVPECNTLIDELRSKLEQKSIDIAMLYYRMADYKASIVTLNNVLKDYPNTKSKELIMFSILETKYQYALKSVESKRKERFTAASESYDDLIAGFPNGEYSEKAKNIKGSIDKALNN